MPVSYTDDIHAAPTAREAWLVVLPSESTPHRIAAGSGVVCQSAANDGSVIVDFEGNLYGAANLSRYADRVWHALGRAQTSYPTVARIRVPLSDFVIVGVFDELWGRVIVDTEHRQLVAAWLDIDVADLDIHLETSGGQHSCRRELAAYARTHPTEARFIARHGDGNMRRAAEAIGLR